MSKPNNRSTMQLLSLLTSFDTIGFSYFTHGSARPHENCCVKFSVKKSMPQFWAPIGPRAPPHCGVCGVSSYATGCGRNRDPGRCSIPVLVTAVNAKMTYMKRGFEARWNEAEAMILTRPRPAVPRPRPDILASRPRP